jgi:hypothetical protein
MLLAHLFRVVRRWILPTAALLLLVVLHPGPAYAAPTPHVWLHYDYLVYPDGSSDAPDPAAVQRVVDAFAAHGIVLHVDNNHAAVPSWTPNVVLGRSGDCRFTSGTTQFFRRVIGLEDVKAQYFHPTANHEWHYALFGGAAYFSCMEPNATSGVAEINGENFIIGRDLMRLYDPVTKVRAEAAFLMHELGHNLGLRHGGFEDTNFKPNYLSVMNYAYARGIPFASVPGGQTAPSFTSAGPAIAGYRLDYSGSALPPLDLLHLDELAGIGAGTTDIVPFCIDKFDDKILWFMTAPGCGPVDWNYDGALQGDVQWRLFDCLTEAELPRNLSGHDDWSAVRGYILGTIQRGPKTIAREDAAEQPAVTGLSPTSGPAIGGTTVTISGVHLGKATEVLFGGVPATSFTLVNQRTIVAVSPPSLSLSLDRIVHVTVVAGDNPSPSVDADQFTYVSMRPVITAVNPPAGFASIEITLTGENFTGTSSVQFFDGFDPIHNPPRAAESFRIVDDHTLVVRTPSCCFTGRTFVEVTNPFGTGGGEFTFLLPPSVSSVFPTHGPASGGTAITVRGSGFTGATAVSFSNPLSSAFASFTVLDDSTLVVVSPPWPYTGPAGAVDIRVQVGSGPGAMVSARTSADFFTYD